MKRIESELNKVRKLLKTIDEEFKKSPPGTLKKRVNQRGTFYFHWLSGKEIGITRNRTLIQQLARKKYLLVRKSQLENNIKKSMEKFDATTSHELINKLPAAYQGLPLSYFYHPSIEPWLAEGYDKNSYSHESGSYFSKNGITLRSKSEVMIADLLDHYQIPYKYELPLKFGYNNKYPDFTIKHPFTGEEILWEHFGALHQKGYEERMVEKMALYMAYDYIPFKNLIYTFEFDLQTQGRLEEIIKSILD